MKLALVTALLLGTGACVADEAGTASRVDPDREVAPFNVADQVELPQITPDNIDFAIVTITGVEIPGMVPTQPNIDIDNVAIAEVDPQLRVICAAAESLPADNVCSSLCDPSAFTARLYDGGSPGGCQQTECQLSDGSLVQVDACTPNE